MRKFDPALLWIVGYSILYLITLKVLPMTAGALTLALLFALIIDIISSLITRFFRIGRNVAVIIGSIVFLGVMSFSIYSIFPIVLNEGKNILNFILDLVGKPLKDVLPNVEEGSQALKLAEDVMDWLGSMFAEGFEKLATTVLSKIPDVATGVTLLIVASTYIALILPRFRSFIPYLFPRSTLSRTEGFLRTFYGNMKRFVGGQIINALLVGVIVWAGMSIFRIKYSGFLGILAGVTDFIPFLGAFITAIPSVFIGLSQKGLMGLIQTLIVLVVANQVEGWILAPKVLGNRVKLNWFIVLVTIIAFSELFGFTGVFISVPFLIVLREIWRYYVVDILKRS